MFYSFNSSKKDLLLLQVLPRDMFFEKYQRTQPNAFDVNHSLTLLNLTCSLVSRLGFKAQPKLSVLFKPPIFHFRNHLLQKKFRPMFSILLRLRMIK